ncbi:MAG: hypothetical protein ABJC26_12395 [Gemmatimonadaceae bacterium]
MAVTDRVDTDKSTRTARNIGVGCFTFFIGGVSGAMTAVLIGKFIGFFQRCEPTQGLPACSWEVYAGWGAVIGALTLPTLAFWRLRRADRTADSSPRG